MRSVGAGTIRVAIIGDVHGHWYADDAEALKSLGVDAAVFIGLTLAFTYLKAHWFFNL